MAAVAPRTLRQRHGEAATAPRSRRSTIGDKEMFGFVVRALDYGRLVFGDDKPDTPAEAMAALEKGLTEYFQQEGIEIE